MGGTSAPPGTVLNAAPVWFDAPVTVTGTGGSLTTNGAMTINGTVVTNGVTSVGGMNVNDLTETLAPSSFGLVDWDFPYTWATGVGGAAVTAGTLYLAKVPMAGGTKITNLWFKIATAASGATTGQNFGGLYSSTGKLLASTGDLTTAIGTNTGPIQAPLSAAYTTTAPDSFYVGFFFNAGTTLPVLSTYVNFTAATTGAQSLGSVTTFGGTAAGFPYAVSATTGNTTALPTSITMSSNTATGAFTYWVGVN